MSKLTDILKSAIQKKSSSSTTSKTTNTEIVSTGPKLSNGPKGKPIRKASGRGR